MSDRGQQASETWWQTAIVEMSPGVIRFHGYPVEELIGRVSFPAMIWLMLRGEIPTDRQAALLGTALMAAVDHGPQAPSIAIARMAATCGVGINNAMASAANVLGDVHGGAGEQCVQLFRAIARRQTLGAALTDAVGAEVAALSQAGIRYVPGFGHRFHPVDPRTARLLEILREDEGQEGVAAGYADIADAVSAHLAAEKGRAIPLNIDGATAAIYAALGFPPPVCRGLFVLSRSVGILAHAWEQMQRTERNKGPMPRDFLWRYTGTPQRSLGDEP